MLWSSRAVAALAMVAMLAACGQGGDKAGGSGQSRQGSDRRKSVDVVDPDMVAAVSSARSSSPISLRFRLSARPVVGTALQVVVALIPAADVAISHIHASFQPGEGLQLQTERNLDVNDPTAGGVIEQELTVVAQQPGVLSLNATIVLDLDGGSLARSYTIPLIASDNPGASRSP